MSRISPLSSPHQVPVASAVTLVAPAHTPHLHDSQSRSSYPQPSAAEAHYLAHHKPLSPVPLTPPLSPQSHHLHKMPSSQCSMHPQSPPHHPHHHLPPTPSSV